MVHLIVRLGFWCTYADVRRCNVNISLLSLSRPNWNVVSFQIVLSPCGGVTLVCRSHKWRRWNSIVPGWTGFISSRCYSSLVYINLCIAFFGSFFASPPPKEKLYVWREKVSVSFQLYDKNKRRLFRKGLFVFFFTWKAILRLTVFGLLVSSAISYIHSVVPADIYRNH